MTKRSRTSVRILDILTKAETKEHKNARKKYTYKSKSTIKFVLFIHLTIVDIVDIFLKYKNIKKRL